MNGHDEAVLDAVAVLALGALPSDEARDVAQHVRTCVICAREYAELRTVADLVGYAAEGTGGADELAAARLKSRIMQAVRPAAGVREASAAAAPAAAPRRRQPAGTWLAYGAAAAALAAALVSANMLGMLRSQHASDNERIAALESQARSRSSEAATAQAKARSLDAAVAALLAPDAKRYHVPGGEVIESKGRVVIALHDVAPPPNGKVYQAWTRTRGTATMSPSVTFTPDPRGVALVELPQSAAGVDVVAVSVEPAGGSKAPTSKPAFVRPLS